MVDWFADLAAGFATIMDFSVLLAAFLGVALGVVVGAIPGLGVAIAISLAIPFTFILSPVTALGFLLGIYKGGIYGGSITAILINTPGTPASAATVLDGYPMALKGQAGKALKMTLYASVFADAFSILILVIVAEPVAKLALKFGPAEVFSLLLFSLTIVAGVSGQSLLKGFIACGVGFMLSAIGQDPITGMMRFDFGSLYLAAGVSLIPMLIGLFAISEILAQCEEGFSSIKQATLPKSDNPQDDTVTLTEFKAAFRTFVRASLIGSFIGALPGIGSTVASFLSYGAEKRKSKRPEEFGKGSLEGLAAAEAGNNAVVGGALIPLITLGIPGDVITAILLGALMIHGVTPGPTVFVMHRDFIFGMFAILLTSILMLYVLGQAGNWAFRRITNIPRVIIFPAVLVLCVVGSFAVNNSMFDVAMMVVFGFVGYLMQKYEFPLPPLLIAFVLGPMAEVALRQALILSQGSPLILVTHPISLFFLIMAVLSAYRLTKMTVLSRQRLQSISAK